MLHVPTLATSLPSLSSSLLLLIIFFFLAPVFRSAASSSVLSPLSVLRLRPSTSSPQPPQQTTTTTTTTLLLLLFYFLSSSSVCVVGGEVHCRSSTKETGKTLTLSTGTGKMETWFPGILYSIQALPDCWLWPIPVVDKQQRNVTNGKQVALLISKNISLTLINSSSKLQTSFLTWTSHA